MKNRRTLTALSGAAISALLLSGCTVELLSADDQCAEVVAEQSPALISDNYNFDGENASSDTSFEFATDGFYEDIYAYYALPEMPFRAYGDGGDSFRDGLNEPNVYGVERFQGEFEIIEGDPHKAVLSQGGTRLGVYGEITPMAIVVACDEAAYNSTTPTASPTENSYPPVSLTNARITQLTPGYSLDHAEVSISAGVIDVDFPGSRNTDFASIILAPWLEGYGDIEDMTYEQAWWALDYSAGSAPEGSANPVLNYEDVNGGDSDFDASFLTEDFFLEWADGIENSEQGKATGAMIVLVSADQLDSNTAQFRYSYHPATFDSNGLLTDVGPQTIDYAGPQYNDDQLKGGPGEQVTLTGSNMLVNSVRIGGQNARIVSNTSTQLTIEIPAGLTAGRYNVDLGFDGGSVTRQLGATVIDHSVWTKRIAPTQAKLYAKNVVGVGKVRFMLNGSEIAWVNAVDANNPKLRKVGAANYLVRTVNLKAGKNVLEIYVDGTREQRTVYTR